MGSYKASPSYKGCCIKLTKVRVHVHVQEGKLSRDNVTNVMIHPRYIPSTIMASHSPYSVSPPSTRISHSSTLQLNAVVRDTNKVVDVNSSIGRYRRRRHRLYTNNLNHLVLSCYDAYVNADFCSHKHESVRTKSIICPSCDMHCMPRCRVRACFQRCCHVRVHVRG